MFWFENGKKIIIGIIAFVIIVMGITILGLSYQKFVKTEEKKIDRQIHEESESYIYGMLSDLDNYYYEYMEYEKDRDEEGKSLVVGVVRSKFSNFDINKVKNEDSKKFLKDIRSGEID